MACRQIAFLLPMNFCVPKINSLIYCALPTPMNRSDTETDAHALVQLNESEVTVEHNEGFGCHKDSRSNYRHWQGLYLADMSRESQII